MPPESARAAGDADATRGGPEIHVIQAIHGHQRHRRHPSRRRRYFAAAVPH
jgi:hypothetical protein